MNGGYALIDCTGLDLSDLGTVPGLYDGILDAVTNGKVIVLGNIVNDSQKFSPITAYGGIEADGVFASFFPVTIHVSEDDEVTM